MIGSLPNVSTGTAKSILLGAAMGPFVGTIGSTVFMASQFAVKTWETMVRKTAANFADHAVIGQKPASEFTGAALDELEFTIKLHGGLGIDPLTETENLREKMLTGEPQLVVMAGMNLGDFTIREMEEEWLYTRYGRPLVIEVTLKIAEFIDTVPSQAQSKRREDELKREDTGKGGPEKLPGTSDKTATQTRNLEVIDERTRMVTTNSTTRELEVIEEDE